MAFPKKIVIATGNAGKLREFETLFAEFGVNVVGQKALGVSDVPETGTTFVENAIIKARHAAKETGLPAIADDSGLVVKALGGAPGIYSARFAGNNATDADNIAKLLGAIPAGQPRDAHFFCTLVLMRHADDPVPLMSQGAWHGTITESPSGNDGFGYDPVFYVPSESCTAAELDKQVKNAISHRGKAMSTLMAQMRQAFA